MQNRYKIIILLLSLLISACEQTTQTSLPKLPADALILAFGDSLTYGTGASAEQDYPAVLEKLSALQVINEGRPGELSSAGLQRLPGLLDQYQPDLLILTHGGNDMLKGRPRENIAANLRSMITAAHERNIAVVLLGVPSPNLFLLESADFYSSVAQEFDIPADTSVLPTILSDNSMKSDTIHPNNAGYQLMAERIYALLQQSGAI